MVSIVGWVDMGFQVIKKNTPTLRGIITQTTGLAVCYCGYLLSAEFASTVFECHYIGFQN